MEVMLNDHYFITGTDTGVGKTLVTGLLAGYAKARGFNVVTQKWVETGADKGFSEDISEHFRIMGKPRDIIAVPEKDRCPYLFKLAASPHLAAREEKRKIDKSKITASFGKLQKKFKLVLVEGAGGALVPVNGKATMIDIARELRLKVLIVAANKLGAVNHCLLTAEAIRHRGLEISGIVFNRLEKTGSSAVLNDNPGIVSKFTGIRILGELPYSRDIGELCRAFEPIGRKILPGR